jgi:hypothetical protein
MKQITIATKREATSAMLDTLFQIEGTATRKMRYDKGKYAGKASDYYGREVSVLDDVAAIWPETRKDKDGPYVVFWCYSR